MIQNVNVIFLLLLLSFVYADDIYDEELVVRRLASGNIATQFRFTTTTNEFSQFSPNFSLFEIRLF